MTTSSARKSPSETSSRSSSSNPDKKGAPAKTSKRASAPKAEASKRPSTAKIARSAAQQLLELTGKASEGVTGLKRSDDGWTIEVEVVEVRRIPDTTDVLALYELEVDHDGNLEGYRRLRRYARGSAQEN